MELITDGFKLMAIGMGMVFLFLTIMVFVISLTAKLLKPYAGIFDEPALTPRASSVKSGKQNLMGNSDEIISAVTAAVHKYRAEH